MRKRLRLPPPRSLPWPLRDVSTAKTGLHYDDRGRMVMSIAHGLLEGLTPAMIAWWFRNIGGDMVVEGQTLNRYHAWHPTDHIAWELANRLPDGTVGVGSRFRIVEAFQADPRYYIDIVDTVTRLDASGVTLVNTDLAGIEITRLNHDFVAAENGTFYRSALTIGIGIPILCRIVNPLIRRFVFPEAMGRAWIRHNIEEVGLLEYILPLLYPAENKTG